MQYSVIKKVILIIFHIIGIHCSTYKHVVEKVRYLENRLNSESMFRAQDYADIIERLDGIDKRLNESLEQSVGFVDNVGLEISDKDEGKHLREYFTRIRRAFSEEKSESSRIRREIPKIENKLISVKQDMERYCVKNLNNTEQLVTLAGETGENLKNEITHQINEIKREQLSLHLDINKTTVKEFEFLSSKIEEIKGDIAETNANIKREQSSLLHVINKTTVKEFELLSSQIEQIKVDTADNNANNKREQLALYHDLNKTTVKEFEFLSSKIEEIKGDIAENNANIKREQSSLVLHINNKIEKEFELLSSQIEQIKVTTAKNNENINLIRLAGGGWTVFQRRQNGKVDFHRNWREYKYGFGDLNGEFWLGNKYLSILTASGDHVLRIDMEDFDGNRVFAEYSKFKVFPEEDKYKLEVSGYSGNAGDSLEYHNGMPFTTFDNDNDENTRNCAMDTHGAWWFKSCHYSHLNGKYFNERDKKTYKGINWNTWKYQYCLKFVEMKFRSRN